jgi:hypothetical protein
MVENFGALLVPASVLIDDRPALALKDALFHYEGCVLPPYIYDVLAYQVTC